MTHDTSVDEVGLVGPDRVRTVVQGLLRAAQAAGWTDDALAETTGIKARTIKSYRVEGKEPSLSAALSIGCVLGTTALNPILAMIGYAARPLDEADAVQPCAVVGGVARGLAVIAEAAADGRFDHSEMPAVRDAADAIIATVMPYSRAGQAA